MAVNRDEIIMYMVDGAPIIGVQGNYNELDNTLRIEHPFRIIPDGKGNITLSSIFMQEDWVRIFLSTSACMELSVLDKMKDIYMKYEQEQWCSIILPNQSGIIT